MWNFDIVKRVKKEKRKDKMPNKKNNSKKKISEEKRKQIENQVQILMKDIGYCDNGKAVDIISVAKKLGFTIINAKMNNGDDGFVIVRDGVNDILGIKTNKLIGVNVDRTLPWKRFIIAHEIAHYLMTPEVALYAHRQNIKGKDDNENEADFFAANLLMPREKFTNRYNELKKNEIENKILVSILAAEFVVTEIMIKRRIKELELDGK